MPGEGHTPRRRFESVVNSLRAQFGTAVGLDTIAAEVELAFGTYSSARVTEFVPIFVERRVQTRLRSKLSSGPFTPDTVVVPIEARADSDESPTPMDYQEVFA